MKHLGLSIVLIATTLYASACNGSESGQSDVSESSSGETVQRRETPPDPNQTCSTDPVQWILYKDASPENVEKARKDSGADTVRVLKPGIAVTQEFKYGRLNLQVDESNIVTSVSCY